VFDGRDSATSPDFDSDGGECDAAAAEVCSKDNKPDITSSSPSSGSPGDIVTLSGSWRSGGTVEVVCFWRLTSGSPYQVYLSGTFTGSGDIECEVPERVSLFSGVPAPAAGDTVHVTVSVFDTAAGDDSRSGICWSDWGAESGHGTHAEFTYESESELTSETESDSEASGAGSSASMGLVVGAVVAGVLVVAVIAMVVMVSKRRKDSNDIEVEVAPTTRSSLVFRNAAHCAAPVYEEPIEANKYYDADPFDTASYYSTPADQVVGAPTATYEYASTENSAPVGQVLGTYDLASNEPPEYDIANRRSSTA